MARKKKDLSAGSVMSNFLKAFGIKADGKQVMGEVMKASTDYLVEGITKQEKLTRELEMAEERQILEAESVLYYIRVKGEGFTERACKTCNQIFAATYYAVAYCSATCRFKALAKYGIAYNIYGKTDYDRWGGRIPKTLSPQALKTAMEVVENEVAAEEAERIKREEAELAEEFIPIDSELEEADIQLQELQAEYEEDK